MKSMFTRVLCLSAALASIAMAQPAFTNAAPPLAAPPIATGFSNTPVPVQQDPLTVNPVLYPETTNVVAAPETKAAPAKPAAPKLPGVGLRGSVKAVDVKAVTFTIGGKEKEHVVHITSASRYLRNGKPATVSEISVNDSFSGRIKKDKNNREVLITGEFRLKNPAPAKK